MLRLLVGDSSSSARMARRSSVAEIIGKSRTNRHTQRQQALKCCESAGGWHSPGITPQPEGGQRQQQPCEIEQQFHL